jgi:hypothetical protein
VKKRKEKKRMGEKKCKYRRKVRNVARNGDERRKEIR